MPIPAELVNGKGNNKYRALVDSQGAQRTVIANRPDITSAIITAPFSEAFVDSSGSSDMLVDGSTTPIDFNIQASDEFDLFITSISVFIQDQNATLALFGALPALTNGVQFGYFTDVFGEQIIQDEIKTNLDFIRLGQRTPPIGGGTTAFRADVTGAGADSYLPLIDISETFDMTSGLRLRKGTNDRIFFKIRDNVSTMDTFNIRGYGQKL